MLYTTTRNAIDTYTAHRALCEEYAPDGGIYVPFHLPVFTSAELSDIQNQSFEDTVAQVLNVFFGLRLNGMDIRSAVGTNSVAEITLGQKVTIAEMWHNPLGDWPFVCKRLYELTANKNCIPVGWSRIAMEIALLFGVYSATGYTRSSFDVAVTADDLSEMTAVLFAKEMGLPVGLAVCACDEKSALWDLVNKGDFSAGGSQPHYLEAFLYKSLGRLAVLQYLDAAKNKAVCHLTEEQTELLSSSMFVAVVSANRVDTVTSSMYNTNRYTMDAKTALSYGALQDYRANTGNNKNTLLIAKQHPLRIKE